MPFSQYDYRSSEIHFKCYHGEHFNNLKKLLCLAAASLPCWQREDCGGSLISDLDHRVIMQRWPPGNSRAWRANPAIKDGGESPRQPHLHWTAPWGLEDGNFLWGSLENLSLKRKEGRKPESCCLAGRSLLPLCQFRHPFRILESILQPLHFANALCSEIMMETQ